MPARAKFLFIVSMDVDPDKEALFNDVYDSEHVPRILKVPGVVSAKRYAKVPFNVIIGGEQKHIVAEGEPSYIAVYELESADVLTSQGWVDAIESGRWPAGVRPFTHNRRHVLHQLIEP